MFKKIIVSIVMLSLAVLVGCAANTTYLAPGEKLMTFVFPKDKSADISEVYLSGDFHDWEPKQDAMKYNESTKQWEIELALRPGTYAYKFVINGTKWVKPPKAAKFQDDGYGGKNAVIEVK